MGLLNLVNRDQLFPREVYRLTFDRLIGKLPEPSACRLMVDLLALAHDRGCEAGLAMLLTADLAAGQIPDLATLRTRFAPAPAGLPKNRRSMFARTSNLVKRLQVARRELAVEPSCCPAIPSTASTSMQCR